MKVMKDVYEIVLARVNDDYWRAYVATPNTNVAYRYDLTEQDAVELQNLLNNGTETTYTLDDGLVKSELVLNNKNNVSFSINGAKMSLFRRRLAKPKTSLS